MIYVDDQVKNYILDVVQATEVLRSMIMGWFFERHFRGSEIPGSGEALLRVFELIAER